MKDVEEGISVTETCLELARDDFDRGNAHSYLSQAYQLRYRYELLPGDLDLAILHAAQSLEYVPEGDRAAGLTQYALVLQMRFDADREVGDLDKAIELAREALNHPRVRPHNYQNHVENLAALFFMRMEASEEEEEVKECGVDAMKCIEEILQKPRSVALSRTLLIKAQLLISTKSPYHDIHAALGVLKQLVDDETYLAGERIECVTKFWGETRFFDSQGLARDRPAHEKFLEILLSAVHLLPRFANFNLAFNARLKILERVTEGLALTAASSAMTLGKLGLALEIIEESRATFWSQILNLRLRRELDDLPESIREPLLKNAAQLEEGSFMPPTTVGGKFSLNESAQERDLRVSRQREAAAEFLRLVHQAREVPGFERFMLPHSAAYLATAAREGPVVVLATDDECSALVVTGDGLVRHLRLALSLSLMEQMAVLWDSVSRRMRERSREGGCVEEDTVHVSEDDEIYGILRTRLEAESTDAQRAVRKKAGGGSRSTQAQMVLAGLWVFVVRPVLSALKLSKPSSRSQRTRLWWCATKVFAHLPIHAAGMCGLEGETEGCSDYVVSSYTPTLQALIDARKSYRPVKRADARILLGAAPHPYTGTHIPATVEEIRCVSKIVPKELVVTLDAADDALADPPEAGGISVATALARLSEEQTTTILHIASHGQQNASDPLSSGFLLRDGKLTILDLMRHQRLEEEEGEEGEGEGEEKERRGTPLLAFLSACETARVGKDYAHEAVHLAATMLFVGFKSVVGTMWSMDDMDGPEVAKRVYERLFASELGDGASSEYLDPNVVPYAVDEAVCELRAKNASSSRWATYIHVGM
ncbi:CHAT domain-containing protein [Irpex rosettiformis]|uniref:CHAT domain-containing protein n=1 Tax=Irpex rosettiformis TaxID=378272 RepID=A0ACB8U2N1_9APHY|nr:CHAT domain-containing protein [Irpex rosettiformis]